MSSPFDRLSNSTCQIIKLQQYSPKYPSYLGWRFSISRIICLQSYHSKLWSFPNYHYFRLKAILCIRNSNPYSRSNSTTIFRMYSHTASKTKIHRKWHSARRSRKLPVGWCSPRTRRSQSYSRRKWAGIQIYSGHRQEIRHRMAGGWIKTKIRLRCNPRDSPLMECWWYVWVIWKLVRKYLWVDLVLSIKGSISISMLP